MWKLRLNEFKPATQILLSCATEPELESMKCFSAPPVIDWAGRQVLIFKISVLRIPVRKMSRPYSYSEKRFDYVRKLWFRDLRNDYNQYLILFSSSPYLYYIYTSIERAEETP